MLGEASTTITNDKEKKKDEECLYAGEQGDECDGRQEAEGCPKNREENTDIEENNNDAREGNKKVFLLVNTRVK
jgi:hypothetical protein